ncbi:TPA: HNH endonuclease [Yersinia enterocolitica]|uniref:HNH endonuclease n=1 Tax=Yersinia enterocolitica TaxID=630 RepID=UPI0005E8347B|nr:HNH endonuclease [Yersinia enterocolitica]EKN3682208.1 HNH endonuclease [Yersinia enterocolitica]EKN4830599.1 HNH endonuclease [Yersinia enterocolitica]EKN4853955.1 HNH endonuclease [Yersinia enterocolitica]EKN6109354.1 endonuclease [Yersinia enterocolitica]ELW8176975.1 HNH endonuclease [Yersinia enterocolitica]
MSRTDFIKSLGATCKNWTWSWSFIDDVNKKIIFGAWEDLRSEDQTSVLILSDNWKENEDGDTKLGYVQAREHLDKVIFEGYQLYTFSQKRKKQSNEKKAAKIESFEKSIKLKYLVRDKKGWYATEQENYNYSPEIKEEYYEGDMKEKRSTYYERNPKARKECLEYHGYNCKVCDFNFKNVYGDLGKDYIQVHHINPISTLKKKYKIDPINHLIPVCANCHVMLHIGQNVISIEELKNIISKKKSNRK